ncbi:MAG: ice-binding family protein [Gaiellaceae bacterium]
MTLSIFKRRPGARSFRSRATWATGLSALFVIGILVGLVGGASAAPTTVPLGTADGFAVLAGSGITNTGASTISGDVGSSPTHSETGFGACPGANCVNLTGANHNDPDPNDATTQGAKSALTTAYDNAAGRSPTTVLTELAGQTLVGGVYTSASGTFGMTGTLVLDGENNADAVFIFQTASTLITGGTGNITLIRGAQACNIFWKVGSAATLGAGSTFRGTILAHDDISLGDGVTVDGRLLAGEQASGAGAVTLIHDTITKPTCAALPSTTATTGAATTQTTTTQTTTTSKTKTKPKTTPKTTPKKKKAASSKRGNARPARNRAGFTG